MTLLQSNSASAIGIQSTGSINYARALRRDASILRAYGDNRVAEETKSNTTISSEPTVLTVPGSRLFFTNL
jgi:hypothetical protein